MLENLNTPINAAIFGASGGIGNAFIEQLIRTEHVQHVHGFSRSGSALTHGKYSEHILDITDENAIEQAAKTIKEQGQQLNLIIIATGLLHREETSEHTALQPEKSMRALNSDNMQDIFLSNTIAPTLVMKNFLSLIPRDEPSLCSALSARVGSISDNEMGGWHSYRASKAALNMMIKNIAIETGRRHKKTCIIGLHPGTVNTGLSKPFQGNVPDGKLFTAEQSAAYLLDVIAQRSPEDSGKCFDWKGDEIQP
jgi:NAD(P)-dependent dehydrogenase (short-subunit alcohol dehydrogenase family)